MSKKNKKNGKSHKKWIALGALILLLIAGLAVIIGLSVKFIPKTSNPYETIITVVVACLTFVGTMVLGIIAYWQTKNANDLSVLLAKKEMSTFIRLGSSAHLELEEMNIKDMLNFAEKYSVEFAICSEKTREEVLNSDLNVETRVLLIKLELSVKNAPLDNLYLTGFGFNTELKPNDLKDYCKIFNVLNNNPHFSVIYNPLKGAYYLNIYVDCDMEFFKMLYCESLLVIDLSVVAESFYGMKTCEKISINLENITDYDRFIADKKKDLNIEYITIHKGDENL